MRWLRHKGVVQDHVGRTKFSSAVGNHGKSIFQAKGVDQPGRGTGVEVPIRRDKAKPLHMYVTSCNEVDPSRDKPGLRSRQILLLGNMQFSR